MPFPLDRIKGSIPPLFTPFRNGEVDYDTYARMIEHQIKEGSHGILVNGTTSEPASLTVEERNRLVTLTMTAGARQSAGGGGDRLAVARRDQGAHGARGESRCRCAADCHAVLLAPAAARHGAILSRSRRAVSTAMDDLSHPRPRCGERHRRYREGAEGQVADVRRHEARRDRSRFRQRLPCRCRPRLQDFRRAGGAVVPDDGGRRLRADERGRQPQARRACRNVRSGRGAATSITRRSCITACTRSTRRCSSTPTRSR